MVQGKDGQTVVVVIGGHEKGMEIWNLKAKTVELLWDEIPPEKGLTSSLDTSEIVTINKGTEFLLYGGKDLTTDAAQDGIWKYIVSENSWERYVLTFMTY